MLLKQANCRKKIYFFLFFLLTTGVFGQQIAAFPLMAGSENMIWINGGTFTMGSPANESGRSGNEGPQRQITVSSFFMGRYPVTQAEYQEIMGTTPSAFKGPNLPVEQVSWFDAVEYCNKLSIKEGLVPAYTITGSTVIWNREANGYRLPTEAEWEYACRAGTQTAFSGGTSIGDSGWYSGNSRGATQPVGEKLPNPWGLHDMHGNILEWCWDLLGSYTAAAQTDPQGAATGNTRVYRGGCWRFEPHQARSAFRFGNHPYLKTFILGFRIARSA